MASREPEVIELSDDENEESQLQQAIALSLGKPPPDKGSSSTAEMIASDKAGLVSFGSLQLHRKQMEADRLARLRRKRKMDDEPDSLPPSHKTKLSRQPTKPTPPKSTAAEGTKAPDSSCQTVGFGLPFAKGVVKRTWASGHGRHGDDIKIEEILQKEELELAVMASFQWDTEWLIKKIDLRRTKLIFVAYAEDEAHVCSSFISPRL
jgi:hypothetical protein